VLLVGEPSAASDNVCNVRSLTLSWHRSGAPSSGQSVRDDQTSVDGSRQLTRVGANDRWGDCEGLREARVAARRPLLDDERILTYA